MIPGVASTWMKVTGSTVIDSPTDPFSSAVLVGGEGSVDGESVPDVEAMSAPGVVFRPLQPSKVNGEELYAEAIALRTLSGLVPIAWRDLRLNRAFPNPQPGDVGLAGYGSNFLKLARDGTITIATTTDATPDGQMIYVEIGAEGFVLLGPFGKITYDAGGFHLLHHSGARLDLGGIGGLPSPLSELGSYATIGAAIAKIEASTIVLGPNAGVADNVAKSTPVLAALTAIQTALTAVAAGFTGLANGAGAVTGPNVAAIPSALTALGAALTAAASATGIPSQSTSVT